MYLLGNLSFSADTSLGGGSSTKPLGLLTLRFEMNLFNKFFPVTLGGLAESVAFLSADICGMLILGRSRKLF